MNDWKSALLYAAADCNGSRNSAVSMVTSLAAAWRIIVVLGMIERAFTPALGPTQPAVQCALGAFLQG
jgi:hypothetical protein